MKGQLKSQKTILNLSSSVREGPSISKFDVYIMLALIQKMLGKPKLLTHQTAYRLMHFLPEVLHHLLHEVINALMICLSFSCLKSSSHPSKAKTNNLIWDSRAMP